MDIFELALGTALKVGKVSYKGASALWNAGMIGRSAAGAAVGAGIGWAKDDSYNPNITAASIAKGAMFGAAAGLSTTAIWPLAKGIPGAAWNAAPSIARGAWRGANALLGARYFLFNHPGLILGGVGAAYGVNSIFNAPQKSPTFSGGEVNTRYDQQQVAAEQMQLSGVNPSGRYGAFPEMSGPIRDAFQNSTRGLVQGMHGNRHGGG